VTFLDQKKPNPPEKIREVGLPAPLVSPEISVSGFPSFMLNTQKLMASELMAKSTGTVFKAAVRLWCFAWQQTPPASLPDDEKVLAKFSGIEPKHFKKLKDQVMRGFVLCSDGRWYHTTLADEAHQGHRHRLRRQKDTERMARWRERHDGDASHDGHDENDVTRDVTRDGQKPVTRKLRVDKTRQDIEGDTPDRPVGGPSEKRATRWPADAVVPDEWIMAAATRRSAEGLPPVNLTLQTELFTNYWASKSGKDATKIDWKRTWINWVLNAKGDANGQGRGSKSTAEYAGARAAAEHFLAQGRSGEGGGDSDDAVSSHPALPSH
jgi:Protein of unknown function (DUF1376)